MPVEFLTPEQRSCNSCYVGEPSPEQLALYFHLDDRDRVLLEPRRRPIHAWVLLLSFAPFGFWIPSSPIRLMVPHNAILTLATQLSIIDLTVLDRYRDGLMHHDHVHEIIAEHGCHDFSSQPAHFRFLRWLYTHAWWSEERLTVLFDLATEMVPRYSSER